MPGLHACEVVEMDLLRKGAGIVQKMAASAYGLVSLRPNSSRPDRDINALQINSASKAYSPISGPLLRGGSFKRYPWSATACKNCERILSHKVWYPVSDMSALRPIPTAYRGVYCTLKLRQRSACGRCEIHSHVQSNFNKREGIRHA
jgi:hypothetical protein